MREAQARNLEILRCAIAHHSSLAVLAPRNDSNGDDRGALSMPRNNNENISSCPALCRVSSSLRLIQKQAMAWLGASTPRLLWLTEVIFRVADKSHDRSGARRAFTGIARRSIVSSGVAVAARHNQKIREDDHASTPSCRRGLEFCLRRDCQHACNGDN